MTLENLNEMQRQAVLTHDKPLCILAGAGTGKTRVITHRIAHLIQDNGIAPKSIMGVTFTNKAAQEMRDRIENLLPSGAYGIQLGTFHGIGARWLRRLGHHVGVSPSFLIYDEDDALRLKAKIAQDEYGISKDALEPYLKQIENWQNLGVLPNEIDVSLDDEKKTARSLYGDYCNSLLSSGALDFNSILLKWKELLENPEAAEVFFSQVKHLLVDEYQDTNWVQAAIVHRIGKSVESVAIVGDDDQSIYGWRGADANNLQNFLSEFSDAKLVKLEQNYRSTKAILDAANAVISNNEGRIGKSLFSLSAEGERVRIIRSRSDRQEAERIVDMIRREIARGSSASTFAILMRTNAQTRLFEESLRRNRMPFKLVGGTKFYDRREIKDALATLRASINAKSDVDFLRALNCVSRGVGAASLKKVSELAKRRKLSLNELCQDKLQLSQSGISKRAFQSLSDFANQLLDLGSECDQLEADEAVVQAIQISGLSEKFGQSKNPQDADRLENLHQLVLAARSFVEESKESDTKGDVLSFLETSALMSNADESYDKDGSLGAVTLMTLHAAKGLEFENVFLVGMEEYGFPHARALKEDADANELEEERRLAYVGMTRAMQKLYLSHADQRMVFGTLKSRMPSRFLGESQVGRFSEGETRERIVEQAPSFSGSSTGFQQDIIIQEDGPAFIKGSRVNHATFGRGTVLSTRGAGALKRATIRFDQDHKERTIVTTHLSAL